MLFLVVISLCLKPTSSNSTTGHTHWGNQKGKRHMYPNVHRSTVYKGYSNEKSLRCKGEHCMDSQAVVWTTASKLQRENQGLCSPILAVQLWSCHSNNSLRIHTMLSLTAKRILIAVVLDSFKATQRESGSLFPYFGCAASHTGSSHYSLQWNCWSQ